MSVKRSARLFDIKSYLAPKVDPVLYCFYHGCLKGNDVSYFIMAYLFQHKGTKLPHGFERQALEFFHVFYELLRKRERIGCFFVFFSSEIWDPPFKT